MYQRFRHRPPFASWEEQVLRDYCDYALRLAPDESALQLACDPLHEASVYVSQKGKGTIYALLPELRLPVTFLRAPREFYFPDMSHFIPTENPGLVAGLILEAVEEGWSGA